MEGEFFSNTPEVNLYLVRGEPSYLGGRHRNLASQWGPLLQTAETIRAGAPQAKLDYSDGSPERVEEVRRFQHAGTIASGHDLVARYDFSAYHSLVDVGGGSGGLAIAVTEACPHIRGTVVDLPSVTPITQRFIEEAGATDRVQVVSAKVVSDSITGSYDVAVLRRHIIVLSADQARRVLNNVSQAIEPCGAIYIIGHVTDDSRISPP